MTPEPQRLQYLEAMGLTAWVARYALPNARPTPACDWELPEAPPPEAPGERLHALLDEAVKTPSVPREAPEPSLRVRGQRPVGPGKARALLGGAPPEATPPADDSASDEAAVAPAEALHFTFQVTCLEGRWLLLLPGEAAPERTHLALLGNLLQAAGVPAQALPPFEPFRWPLQEGLPVEAPLDEARQGVQAFVAGARRRGWQPERLLLFGHDEALDRVLTVADGRCPLLELPAWQGPALAELAVSAEAKRALLPQLLAWGQAWQASAEERSGEG
ncbi:hypothetical protein [Halomonas campaniensis]|uniref:hypothetical protein n=1 Tax=Halomonas campaniensis TaxID=213554 RepID=UPI00356AE2BA